MIKTIEKVIMILLLSTLSCPVWGASFPCYQANKPVEKMICENKALSFLDDHLNAIYKMVLLVTKNVNAIREQQRRWLNTQRDQCPEETCLINVYEQRIAFLRGIVEKEAEAIPGTGFWRINYPLSGSTYCRLSGHGGSFQIRLQREGQRVCGSIYHEYDCGRKISDSKFRGFVSGNLAIVDFYGGRSESWGKAYLAISRTSLRWVVFLEVQGECYIPSYENLKKRQDSHPFIDKCETILSN